MTSAQEWIDAYARQLGVDPPDEDTVERLLQLAGLAAHTSERLAAPLACYLVGVTGISADVALDAARTTVSEVTA